jgi:hypothetical protein
MAITLVQHAQGNDNFTSGTTGQVVVNLGSAITLTNCVVAVVSFLSAGGGDQISSVTTNGSPDNWALSVIPSPSQVAAYPCTIIAVNQNASVSSTHVDINATFGSTYTTSNNGAYVADVYEFSGVSTSGAVDQSAVDYDDSYTPPPISSGTTGTTTQANEVFVGGAYYVIFTANTSSTLTGPASPWINEAQQTVSAQDGGTSTADKYYGMGMSGYQIVSATGTTSYGVTSSVNDAGAGSGAVVTLKAASTAVTNKLLLGGFL